MRKFKFYKLVRDKIVERIKSRDNVVNSRILGNKEYFVELQKKLVEESQEFCCSKPEKFLEELADVQEVINNLLGILNISKDEFRKEQVRKNKERGSFAKKIYIEDIEVQNNDPWIDYYLSYPDKYPEVINKSQKKRVRLRKIVIGEYKHYKGKHYKVIGVGRHSETLEELVIYRALYNSEKFGPNALWVRPKKIFLETIIHNDKEMLRFKYIEPLN